LATTEEAGVARKREEFQAVHTGKLAFCEVVELDAVSGIIKYTARELMHF
jgi:hypothetical protein